MRSAWTGFYGRFMRANETFQIPLAAAELYETHFVPSVFAEWAPVTLEAAAVAPGQRLLDLACGTGIVARTAHRDSAGGVMVTGMDLNEAMLTVAARVEPAVDWRQGDVVDLPFDAASFDSITCQMAFMFFPDRVAALAEMARVLAPGGRIGIVVPASLDAQPAYGPFVDVSAQFTGDDARSLLGTYWNCGDLTAFTADIRAAGFNDVTSRTRAGSAHFESVTAFVDTEIDGSPLADRVTDEQRSSIVATLRPQLQGYETESANLSIPLVCHVLSASL